MNLDSCHSPNKLRGLLLLYLIPILSAVAYLVEVWKVDPRLSVLYFGNTDLRPGEDPFHGYWDHGHSYGPWLDVVLYCFLPMGLWFVSLLIVTPFMEGGRTREWMVKHRALSFIAQVFLTLGFLQFVAEF